MNIVINTTKKTSEPKKTQDSLKREIVDKLNGLVSSKDFFYWKDSNLYSRGCANVELHNRLVILLALFSDSHYEKWGVFTSFNSTCEEVSFRNYNNFEKLELLKEFVDSIPALTDVKISLQ